MEWKYIYVDWDGDQDRQDVFFGDSEEEIKKQVENRPFRSYIPDYLYTIKRVEDLGAGYTAYYVEEFGEAIIVPPAHEPEAAVFLGDVYSVAGDEEARAVFDASGNWHVFHFTHVEWDVEGDLNEDWEFEEGD